MMQVSLQIPGFSILEIVQESSYRILAKARSEKRKESVLLKILRATLDRNVIQARLRRESDLIDKYQLEGFAKPIEILELEEYLISVLEDFGDETLSHYAEHFPLSLSPFFDLAISIVTAIDELHQNGVNHMRLCPDNILVHRATRKVKILDLETASMLNSEVNMSLGLNTIDTEVAYIAPEQSGRMNRHVDLRSNLYSLGCIFYEVLTGQRVFTDENVADLVYAHMAKAPIPLTNHVAEIPLMLEAIILKLLNKNAEDRYQSIRGLRHDLEQCQKLWESNQHIESFTLGQYDTTSSLVFSQKLYGRDEAIGILEREFDKAVKGHFSLLFISGYSGIGKTKLVKEVHKSITAENGFFLNGKVDQMEKSIPYAGLIAALSDFVNHLLTTEKSTAQNYTERITRALKDQGKLIVDVLPELGLLLGPQPDIPALPVAESQNRFQDVLCRFVGSLSYEGHPLTIFLDDLQWADLSSLKLIHRLSQYEENRYLMFIGAYRDNEVGPTHPLRSVFEDLKTDLQPYSEIHLEALSQESVNDFVSDSLHRDKDDTRLLSQLIAKQTGSNPFFIKLLLTRLVDDNYVHLDPKTLEWNWDIQKVKEAGITDNVVDLLTENLERLPIESQNILQYAACIGNNFDLYTLKESTGSSAQEIARDLWIPLSKNIIVPLSETYKTAESYLEVDEFENVQYKFAHDRAQQAAYNLLDEEERMKLHLKIGEQLNHALTASQLDTELFDVTNHFNIGLPLIPESSIAKREFIRFLNLRTANKARLSSSFTVALNYYRQAYQLFKEEDWTYYLDSIAQASLDLAECEYICGNYEEAGKMYDVIYAHTSDQKYISRLYDIQLRQYAQEGRNKETLLLGGEILKKYGVGFRVEPPLYVLAPELIQVKGSLWRKDISALVDLPKLENEDKAFAIQTLMNISATAYVYDINTMLMLVLRMMQLSLKYGNAPESAFGYGLFGFVEGAALGNASQSRAFADLSIELIKDVDDPIIRAKVIFLRAFSTQHWFEPIPLALPELREAFNLLDQSGSYTFASYCLQASMAKRLYLGESLDSYSADLIDYLQYAYKVKEIYTQNLLGVLRTYVNTLSGNHEDEFRLYGDEDEEVYLSDLKEKRLLMPVAWHYVYHMMSNYHFDDIKAATTYAKKAKIVDDVAPTTMAQIEYHFYTVLLLAKKYKNASFSPILSMRIRWALRKLRNWSIDCPENFEIRYLLAKAQWKAVQNNIHAADLFQEVYQKSLLNNDIFTQGMILEHWAEFLMEKGEVKNALSKLEMSVSAYKLYGADEKAKVLQERFLPAHLYEQKQDPTSIDSIIDIETLLRASRVISGDIQLDKLLVNLLTMLTENAGAQRGFLILVEDDELLIQGEYDISTKEPNVLHRMPARDSEKISTSIVNYVWRTAENVLIDDARVKSAFMNDPHLKSREVRSILCVPVANQGNTNAIIYLENNLASNVFTEKKLNMVSMLASQAAVSLDNALLYNSLEEKVATRTQELSNEKQRVDDLLLNMFPAEVAEELKLKGEAKTRLFENATILFGDFKNFTIVAEKMTPENLVQLIDLYFSAYDKIMKKYGIEKIKTIGDAYVAAGGLPDPRKGSAKEVVQAAIAMQEFTEREKLVRESKGLPFFEIRIGIHSGRVIAGVVGHLKFAYDIWGDTVNLAARMEQNGEIRKINISEHTYDLIKDEYECTYRGKIEAKNKGEVDMYFVNF